MTTAISALMFGVILNHADIHQPIFAYWLTAYPSHFTVYCSSFAHMSYKQTDDHRILNSRTSRTLLPTETLRSGIANPHRLCSRYTPCSDNWEISKLSHMVCKELPLFSQCLFQCLCTHQRSALRVAPTLIGGWHQTYQVRSVIRYLTIRTVE